MSDIVINGILEPEEEISGEMRYARGTKGDDGTTFTPNVDENGDISWTNNGGKENPATRNIKGPAGDDGTTFTPNVDENGNISWTNDSGKENPATRNIKGPAGPTGPQGDSGVYIGSEEPTDPDTKVWIDTSGKAGDVEMTTNKVTSLSDKSTNVQYPSANAVYTFVKRNSGAGKEGSGLGAEVFNAVNTNQASGEYSHAENYSTRAIGKNSHAGGNNSSAIGAGSFAHGLDATANSDFSVAMGYRVKNSGSTGQAVFGKYNKQADEMMLIVGNGTGEGTERSNAFMVNRDGSAKLATNGWEDDNVVRYEQIKYFEHKTVLNYIPDQGAIVTIDGTVVTAQKLSELIVSDQDRVIIWDPSRPLFYTISGQITMSNSVSFQCYAIYRDENDKVVVETLSMNPVTNQITQKITVLGG